MRSEHGEERLFDLRADPDERHNLAAIRALMTDVASVVRELPPR